MRISPINVNNNTNKNQHPSFGMKLVNNGTLENVISFLKIDGMSKKGTQDLFRTLDRRIDDTYTIEFKNVKRDGGFRTITGTICNEKNSTDFEINHLIEANSILKQGNQESHLKHEFVTEIVAAKNALVDLAKPAKEIYNKAIQKVFGE